MKHKKKKEYANQYIFKFQSSDIKSMILWLKDGVVFLKYLIILWKRIVTLFFSNLPLP